MSPSEPSSKQIWSLKFCVEECVALVKRQTPVITIVSHTFFPGVLKVSIPNKSPTDGEPHFFPLFSILCVKSISSSVLLLRQRHSSLSTISSTCDCTPGIATTHSPPHPSHLFISSKPIRVPFQPTAVFCRHLSQVLKQNFPSKHSQLQGRRFKNPFRSPLIVPSIFYETPSLSSFFKLDTYPQALTQTLQTPAKRHKSHIFPTSLPLQLSNVPQVFTHNPFPVVSASPLPRSHGFTHLSHFS